MGYVLKSSRAEAERGDKDEQNNELSSIIASSHIGVTLSLIVGDW